jgi:hypothetical protein
MQRRTSRLTPHPRPILPPSSSPRERAYTALPFNHVPSYFLFGLNATYDFEHTPNLQGLQVYMQANNLFNRQPIIKSTASTGGTNPAFYDTLGMAYRVGFRMSFQRPSAADRLSTRPRPLRDAASLQPQWCACTVAAPKAAVLPRA